MWPWWLLRQTLIQHSESALQKGNNSDMDSICPELLCLLPDIGMHAFCVYFDETFQMCASRLSRLVTCMHVCMYVCMYVYAIWVNICMMSVKASVMTVRRMYIHAYTCICIHTHMYYVNTCTSLYWAHRCINNTCRECVHAHESTFMCWQYARVMA